MPRQCAAWRLTHPRRCFLILHLGLANAIGQAGWELDHRRNNESGGGSVTGTKKLDNKLRTLAEDLGENLRKTNKTFSKLGSNDGALKRVDVKRGLQKLSSETGNLFLSDREMKSFFSSLNRAAGGQGGNKSISMSDFRQFVRSGGSMLLEGSGGERYFSAQDGFTGADDVIDSDVQIALERCAEEFEDLGLSRKRKNKVRQWFEKNDHDGRGSVSSKAFSSFLKKSKLGGNLSKREKNCLVEGLSDGKGRVDYGTFIDAVVDQKSIGGGRGSSSAKVDAVLGKIQEAVNVFVKSSGGSYGMIFVRCDPSGSGLVTKDAFIGAFRGIGCFLSEDEVSCIGGRLKSRRDGMLDYNDLYQVLLQTTPRISAGYPMATPFNATLTSGATMTPWGGGGMTMMGSRQNGGISMQMSSPYRGDLGQTWPPPGGGVPSTPWSTPFNPNMTLGGSAAMGGGGAGGDYMLQDVALKLRNAMRQRVSQWGPSVSLHRQFEASDPDRRGYIGIKSFLSVLEQLGVQLVPVEVGIISRRFDRHGNDTIDYLDFCRFVSIDAREMEIVASKLAGKFAELRRRGVSATATFDVYDIGRTGFVTRRDFRECSRQLQLPITENQLEALMGRFAHQGDGDSVSWQEFITFVNASGVNLPLDEMEGPVLGDGYDGMDAWYEKVSSGGGEAADRAGGTPKRARGGLGDYRSMYRSLGAADRKGWNDDEDIDFAKTGANSSVLVDHSSTARGGSHMEDLRHSRELGREAVNYLDNHGVSTPKWIRSVLKVGRGKEGFDNNEEGDSDMEDDLNFGSRTASKKSARRSRRKARKGGSRSAARYNSDDDSDIDLW